MAADGVIYDRFDRGTHVHRDTEIPRASNGMPDLTNWHVVFDYGTSNPFNAGLYGYHHGTGRVWKVREWRWDGAKQRRQLTDDEYVQALVEWAENGYDGLVTPGALPLNHVRVVGDPSAVSIRIAFHRKAGVRVLPAPNTVIDGIRDVSTLLGADRFTVNEKCVHTLREVEGYVWDPKQQENGIDAPLKKDDHAMDETRYAVRSMKPIWQKWQPTARAA